MFMKYCNKCRETKSIAEFGKDRQQPSGVHSYCKECVRKISAAWRSANAHKHLEYNREWYLNNKERKLVTGNLWKRNNPQYVARENTKRRCSKHAATPQWAEKDKIKIVYEKAKQYGLHVDHIVPINHSLVCGLHVWHNLQLLDKPLNSRKSNKEWPDM